MADENVSNGEVFDDAVDIAGEEAPDAAALKTSALTEKIAALEQENNELLHENKIIKERIEKLKDSIEESEKEKAELQKKLEKTELEIKALGSVAARAAELETELSRLQHDLITTMSDLQETNVESSELKLTLEGLKSIENEKSIKLGVVESERNLLLSKVEKLENSGVSQRAEVELKEKEIRGLKKQIEDLEAAEVNNKESEKEKEALHKVKDELESRANELMARVAELEKKLVEKDRVITERLIDGNIHGIPAADDEAESFGVKLEWPVVAVSSIAAVSVVGILCYLRYGRKP